VGVCVVGWLALAVGGQELRQVPWAGGHELRQVLCAVGESWPWTGEICAAYALSTPAARGHPRGREGELRGAWAGKS
jgi:hypothetical protein